MQILFDKLFALSFVFCVVCFLFRNCSVEGGELFDRVVSVMRFEEPIAKLLFYQMLVAVKVCYKIMHLLSSLRIVIVIKVSSQRRRAGRRWDVVKLRGKTCMCAVSVKQKNRSGETSQLMNKQ